MVTRARCRSALSPDEVASQNRIGVPDMEKNEPVEPRPRLWPAETADKPKPFRHRPTPTSLTPRTALGFLLLVALVSPNCLADDKPLELNTTLMRATVRIEGMTPQGPSVATGFIMGRPIPNTKNRARYVLITANHVFDESTAYTAVVITRKMNGTNCEKVPVTLPIRSLVSNFSVPDASKTPVLKGSTFAVIFGATRSELKPISDSLASVRDSLLALNLGLEVSVITGGRGSELQVSLPNPNIAVPLQLIRIPRNGPPEPLLIPKQLWTRHPTADVAAIYLSLPNGIFDDILLPTSSFLATDEDLKRYEMHPGDDLNCLGYPLGQESNSFGFPILRSGKLAPFPLLPTRDTISFLMDFQIFKGNSGGPVYVAQSGGTRLIDGVARLGVNFQTIVGLVSEEMIVRQEQQLLYERSEHEYPLKLARVVHASLIRETIDLLEPPVDDTPASHR